MQTKQHVVTVYRHAQVGDSAVEEEGGEVRRWRAGLVVIVSN